jgi:hypothetical protein
MIKLWKVKDKEIFKTIREKNKLCHFTWL